MIFWTLPNIITLLRIGALPIVVLLAWPGIENPLTGLLAAFFYALGGILDMVDGALARRTNQVTVLGKFLDPLVDKVFYLVTLISLLQLPGPRIPPWVVMLILTRELAITGLRGIAASEGIVIAASDGGKLKTTLATIGVCALLIHYPFKLPLGGWHSWLINPHGVGMFFTYLSLIFALTSAYSYIRGFINAVRK